MKTEDLKFLFGRKSHLLWFLNIKKCENERKGSQKGKSIKWLVDVTQTHMQIFCRLAVTNQQLAAGEWSYFFAYINKKLQNFCKTFHKNLIK